MLPFLLDLFFPKPIPPTDCEAMHLVPVLLAEKTLHERGVRHIHSVVAAGMYQSSPLLQRAIHKFKYGRTKALHQELAAHMTHAMRELLPYSSSAVLCPVPLHWTRRFQRGFNQSELLATCISNDCGYPMHTLLRRTRPTGHQAWRKRRERLGALTGAFRYVGPCPVPEHVILIDDLCTTGTTLSECAMTLKAAGVGKIDALVLAYG